MPDRHQLSVKIRSYLDALSVQALRTLMRGLENARARGSDYPHIDLILDACIAASRRGEVDRLPRQPRRDWLQRMFFSPIADLLVDENLPHKERGRITRASLPLIWTWLQRDVAPEAFASAGERALRLEVEPEEVATLAEDLRDLVVSRIEEEIAAARVDDRARQRLAMQVGGERALRDLADMMEAFHGISWLDPLRESLPERLTVWDFKPGSPSLRRIKAVTDRKRDHAIMIAAVVLRRVEAPEALLLLASNLAETPSLRKIAASPYAAFAEMAFSEAERFAAIVCGECSNTVLFEALGGYHELVKTLDRQFELEEAPEWHRRIAATRRSLSRFITGELEAAASNIRRALAVPQLDGDGQPQIDTPTIEEAKRGVLLLSRMRDAAESLAANEITARTRQALDQTLEIKTRALLGALADSPEARLSAHLAAVDTAICLCETHFGKDYADLLRRSRKAALSSRTQETRATG